MEKKQVYEWCNDCDNVDNDCGACTRRTLDNYHIKIPMPRNWVKNKVKKCSKCGQEIKNG